MRRKLFITFSVFVLLSMILTAATPYAAPKAASISALAATKFDAHYRAPNEAALELLMDQEGISLAGKSSEARQMMAQQYEDRFHKMNPDTPAPEKLRKLLEKEHNMGAQMRMSTTPATEGPERPIKSLVTLVEFPGADAFENCGEIITSSGPLHNEIAPPGPRDNNTVWYEDSTPELYEELYFAEGPNAGVIVHHPNLGEVDLRGSTMANFYLEQSGGKFGVDGMIYPKWLQAMHSEAYYGVDSCDGGSHNIRAHELVTEVVDLVKADNPDFDWQTFDGDGDGIVDNFTVIHAGQGQESGGGAQGDLAIWSHASLVDWPTGYLACEAGNPGCPDRSIYVREYSMDPENIDIGVISEEFGHAAFGLPDIYTTDAQASVSNWAIMEAGSWNGPLGGMMPAPFPLWFRYILGWASPTEIDYSAELTRNRIGQLSQTPAGAAPGLKINLPATVTEVPNPLGTGVAWWSDVGNVLSNTLTREVDLTNAVSPVFSFASYWSIEEDWDYGFISVSTDGGATWTVLPDMDGVLRDTNPNGSNREWGLTGEGMGTLRFDLSPYAGQVVMVQLEYYTDLAVQADGWWADDLAVTDGETVLFSDDCEAGTGEWIASGWVQVPLTREFERYYLVEWRNNSGFDRGLAYPYQTTYYDDDEWQVDRTPYTVPGMLLWLRDTAYAFDYSLPDAEWDPYSLGPKHALLVVDSHYWPYEWSNYSYGSGAQVRLGARSQPGNATFTLQPTTPFTAHLGYDPVTGAYLDEPIEEKTFGPLPAVSSFHDSLGYYPGFWYRPETGGLYYWDRPASAVVPAKDFYSSRITWLDKSPLPELYGADMGEGHFLGSGNPGDDGVQYGLHIAVTGQSKDGRLAEIKTWNAPQLVDLSIAAPAKVIRGGVFTYVLFVKNTSPVAQTFTVESPIPEGTTFLRGRNYDPATDSIRWTGMIHAYGTTSLAFKVQVSTDLSIGDEITNTAVLVDDALGDSATVVSTVVK